MFFIPKSLLFFTKKLAFYVSKGYLGISEVTKTNKLQKQKCSYRSTISTTTENTPFHNGVFSFEPTSKIRYYLETD